MNVQIWFHTHGFNSFHVTFQGLLALQGCNNTCLVWADNIYVSIFMKVFHLEHNFIGKSRY